MEPPSTLDAGSPITVPVHNAYPSLNPLDRYRVAIAQELSRLEPAISTQVAFDSLDRTRDLGLGDLVLALPRLRLKTDATKLGESLVSQFKVGDGALVKRPTPDKITLRFYFEPKDLAETVLPAILTLKHEYGFNKSVGLRDPQYPERGRKQMVVEFSSPNIAKKFHAGHLRSTIIGGFLSTLYERAGFHVTRMNYLGDWGRQFGLLACGWTRYGNEADFEKDPIGCLYDIYVKINADLKPESDAYNAAKKAGQDTAALETQGLLGQAKTYFKSMEDGDEEALSLWRRFRALSIQKYEETYARLNITFTDFSGESQVTKQSMETAELLLHDRGISEFKEGATIVDFAKNGAKKLDVAIIRNRNGTSNYLLRDIGAAVQRYNTYHFDEMLYVVMSEQEVHLNRLFKILNLMGDEYQEMATRMKHISFGRVSGMSTRRGNVKFLDDIIDDVGNFMHDVMRRNEDKYRQVEDPTRTAEVLGISAIMVQDMSGKRINDYEFSLDRMTSFEGDTGPYLQYAHARLCSILRKAEGEITHQDILDSNFSLLSESTHAINLLRSMARFPDMVNQALKSQEPTTILTYLFKFTHELSSSYDHLRVVKAPEGREVSIARAALYEAARQVLRNGMTLLGLTPVERM